MYGVRELDDSNLDPLEGGLMVPLPGAETDSVVFEPRDGDSIRTLVCKKLEMQTDGEKKPFLLVPNIRMRLYVSDARLAFACSKYDKGGGWIGGVGALAMNAGSKALAARRRRGKMLVGHIRYPWISDVYARNHAFMSEPKLRVIVRIPGDESWTRIDFDLPKDGDATAVAAEVIRRAASFRLAHDPELDAKERSQFSNLAELEGIAWNKADGKLAGKSFCTSWPVAERSAYFGTPVSSAVASEAADAGSEGEENAATGTVEPGTGESEGTAGIDVPIAQEREPNGDESHAPILGSDEQRFCAECGTGHELGDAFCSECGADLRTAPKTVPARE